MSKGTLTTESKLRKLYFEALKRFKSPQRVNESNDSYGKRRLYLSTLIAEMDNVCYEMMDKILTKEELDELLKKYGQKALLFDGELVKVIDITDKELNYLYCIYIPKIDSYTDLSN